eukprot:TRINITY_DN115034_c0_g1_i1.p1 TRINITY_DN115034_c0_g1~~TRINITY_DN115034_c0_g1_i1.p1  ORF type:complete len:113 (-),score=7.29 TRINITY_DN115034_c0_g1_i1:350-688(-)
MIPQCLAAEGRSPSGRDLVHNTPVSWRDSEFPTEQAKQSPPPWQQVEHNGYGVAPKTGSGGDSPEQAREQQYDLSNNGQHTWCCGTSGEPFIDANQMMLVMGFVDQPSLPRR